MVLGNMMNFLAKNSGFFIVKKQKFSGTTGAHEAPCANTTRE